VALWRFGDGRGATAFDPTHTFEEAGAYTVELTVCGDGFCDTVSGVVLVESVEGGTLLSGEPAQGAIDFVDDIDVWRFEALAGSELTLDLASPEDAIDPVLRLLGPDGEELASDDDGGPGFAARIAEQFLEEAGTYVVEVEAADMGGSGAYALEIALDPEPLVRARAVVTPEALTPGNTILFVDGSRGGVTSRRWDFGDGEADEQRVATHSYAEPGDYLVRLVACNERSCDEWTVLLRIAAEADGGSVGFDQTVLGAIDAAGDVDEWTFQGLAGLVVSIRVRDQGFPFLDAELTLLGPMGEELAFVQRFKEDLQPRLDAFELPLDGEYTIRIAAEVAADAGAYALEMMLVE
jgi:hypothetical protein